jgi:hypothetical protein
LVVGLWGAVLSTFQLRDSHLQRARRLDVTLSFGAPVAKGVQLPTGLHFRAVNPGYQAVAVAAAGLFLPDGSRVWFGHGTGDWQFPKGVAPGENIGILFAGQDLTALCRDLGRRGFNGTISLVGFCEDGEGRLHRSIPLQFPIEDARKLARMQTSTEVRNPSGE